MKAIRAGFGFALIFQFSTSFAQLSACNALLAHGIKNISIQKSDLAATSFKYYNNCGLDFSAMDSERLANAEVEVFGYGKGKGGLSNKQRAESLRQWCTTNKEFAEKNQALYAEAQTVYSGAVQAWGRCMELQSSNVSVDPMISDDNRTVDISVRFTGPVPTGVRFYGVNAEGFTCHAVGPGFIEINNEQLKKGVEIKPEAISVRCTRAEPVVKTISGQDFSVTPRGVISVRSAGAPVQLFFPPETDPALPQSEAKKLQGELQKLATNLDSANGTIASLRATFDKRKAKLECEKTEGDWTPNANNVHSNPKDNGLIAKGYVLVSSGCEVDGQFTHPILLMEASVKQCWVKSSPGNRVRSIATYCRAVLE
ncbi:MAG TPA: hypothetical protein VEB21_17450 [Terriglobales bacterium]|nr:hypothetical protein [Terriglobales bacterium]